VSFTAKYRGRCNSTDCNYGDNAISPGDDIAYVDDEIMHTECARRVQQPPKCLNCNMIHVGECL